MTTNLEWLLQRINQLSPEDRANLDNMLVGALAKDAETASYQKEFVLASEYIPAAKKLVANWGKLQGVRSGYPSIDRLTKGFVPGEVIVIGGATSVGKTTFAVNITGNVISAGYNVLFCTLEMSKAELTSRLMYTTPNFEDYSARLAYQKADELNWKSVDALVEHAVRDLGVQMVVIDHLHYFTRELNNVAEDLGRITKEFKKNAIRYRVPILLLSHTRKGDGRGIDELRGSSYIAQDADIVLMVSRDTSREGHMLVECFKNRNRGIDYNNNEAALLFDKTKLTEAKNHHMEVFSE